MPMHFDNKICLCLRRYKTQTAKTTQYDQFSFSHRDISNKYTVTIKNKFDNFQETFERYTWNAEYENFFTARMEAAS